MLSWNFCFKSPGFFLSVSSPFFLLSTRSCTTAWLGATPVDKLTRSPMSVSNGLIQVFFTKSLTARMPITQECPLWQILACSSLHDLIAVCSFPTYHRDYKEIWGVLCYSFKPKPLVPPGAWVSLLTVSSLA